MMPRPAFAVLLLALAGCVQTQPPPASLDSARAVLDRAEEVGASERAPDELRVAWRKVQEAGAANAAGEPVRARRLAEQAGVHAELAEAMTLSAQARDVLDAVLISIQVLREETERINASSR